VGALLKREVEDLIQVHCVAHRLNLAAGQATNPGKYLGVFFRAIKNTRNKEVDLYLRVGI